MGEVRKSLKVALKLMAFDQINVGIVQGHGSWNTDVKHMCVRGHAHTHIYIRGVVFFSFFFFFNFSEGVEFYFSIIIN